MKIVPAYTIPQIGPATRAAVDRFLAAPRLMRLGVTEPDGTPLVHPVWYTWEQDQFLLHIPTRSPKRWAMYRAKSAPSGRFPLFEAVEELSRLPPRQRKRFFLGEYSDEIEGGPLDIRVAGSPRP